MLCLTSVRRQRRTEEGSDEIAEASNARRQRRRGGGPSRRVCSDACAHRTDAAGGAVGACRHGSHCRRGPRAGAVANRAQSRSPKDHRPGTGKPPRAARRRRSRARDLDGALRLAVHAAAFESKLDPHDVAPQAAATALASALGQVGWVVSLAGHENGVLAAAFSPDGRASSPLRSTRPRASSMPRPASRSWSCAAMRRGPRRCVQPRWRAHRHRLGGPHRAAVGRCGGKPLAILRGHGDDVRSAVFSPNGAHIVSASSTARHASSMPRRRRRSQSCADMRKAWRRQRSVLTAISIVTASFDATARIFDAARRGDHGVARTRQ